MESTRMSAASMVGLFLYIPVAMLAFVPWMGIGSEGVSPAGYATRWLSTPRRPGNSIPFTEAEVNWAWDHTKQKYVVADDGKPRWQPPPAWGFEDSIIVCWWLYLAGCGIAGVGAVIQGFVPRSPWPCVGLTLCALSSASAAVIWLALGGATLSAVGIGATAASFAAVVFAVIGAAAAAAGLISSRASCPKPNTRPSTSRSW